MSRWISETLFPGARLSFEAERVLLDESGPGQRVQLIENGIFGKVLMLDGAVQLTSADEFIYHEMMAHVPLLAHGAARDVLIVGGGDCGLAEEVLKHAGVQTLMQIEIDPSVIDLAREHFPEMNAAAFADSRFRIEIADGAKFVAESGRKFDVILVDSTDPVGPGAVLFTPEFYAGVRRCLRPGGVAADLPPGWRDDVLRLLEMIPPHERLAAGDAHVAYAVACDLGQDVVDRPPLAAVEGVGGVAIRAAQRAARQPNEHRRPARLAGLALQRQEDLGDAEPVGRGRGVGRVGDDGVHGDIVIGARAGPTGPAAGFSAAG